MPDKKLNVKVRTLDSELEFAIPPKATGKDLFDKILQTTGIREIWYFGLEYTDKNGNEAWLGEKKKIKDLDMKKEEVLDFRFRFKFFPENVVDEVIQDTTLRLLYYQMKSDILKETLYCPPEKGVLLASYAAQVKYGDYDVEFGNREYLANDNILPKSVINAHKLSRQEWEEKICLFHQKHSGASKEDTMLEYLKVTQDLETYGISYHEVKNSVKGTDILVGIDALGINIYPKDNKLNPTVSYAWSEIRKVDYKKKKFIVKFKTGKDQLTMKMTKPKQEERLYDLSVGNHSMYIRRREPDTLEVQQMKSHKQDVLATKARERAILNKEIATRIEAERQKKELEDRFRDMEDRMRARDNELNNANTKINELQSQLDEIKEAKLSIEKHEEELEQMIEEMRIAKNLEKEEWERMEEEVRLKQEEIQRIQLLVDVKEEESKHLQEEVLEARERMEEESRRLQEEVLEARAKMEENEAELRKELEVIQGSKVEFNEDVESIKTSSGESRRTSNTISREDLDILSADIVDPVEEREVTMEGDMMESLEALEETLAQTRDNDVVNPLDEAHRDNLRHGRDKYKTLREVRNGNTKRRIDKFESM